MSIDRKAILDQINAEHPKLDAETRERLQKLVNGFSSYEFTFYSLVRQHHVDQMELKYGVLEKVLNQIRLQDPNQYMKALKLAFNQVQDYCISNRENKIAPLLRTLLEQVKNLDPSIRSELFDIIKGLFVRCYLTAHTLEKEIAESQQRANEEGGDLEFYDKKNKWPLHVIVNSVREVLPELQSFLVSEIRRNSDIKSNTIEQILTNEVTSLLSDNIMYGLDRIGHHPRNIVDSLIDEWELHFATVFATVEQVFGYFETELDWRTASHLTSLALEYASVHPGPQLLNAYTSAGSAAGAGAGAGAGAAKDYEESASPSASL